jgi:hypothetical protein
MRIYIEQEIQRLEQAAIDRGERLRPEDVVEVARDPANVLHEEFVWNDAEAAREHRLDTARKLISGIRIVIQTETINLKGVAYVHDPRLPPGEQGYISTLRLRSQEAAARAAWEAEFERVESLVLRTRETAAALNLRNETEDRLRRLILGAA